MNISKLNYSKRTVLSIVGIAALSFTMAAPAYAAGDGTTATVTGGSLSITTPLAADFAERSITGVDQTTTAALAAFSVSDLTGTGEGWTVTAQATNFNGVTHNLAEGSLEMSQPTVVANGTTSPEPSILGSAAYVLDGGSVATIASADTDEGMGTYDFSATTLTLSLPADVYADAYASTITISVISAP